MRVEIWSDVACPWCYVGKRRFEAALAGFPHREEVRVVWRSFELDPQAPQERLGDYAVMLAAKYGVPVEEGQRMIDTMTAAAATEGLDFHFDRARVGNTFDAHRLLHLAHDRGVQDALKERLLRATFSDGEPIGNASALSLIAVDAGLDAEEVASVLASGRYGEQVRADQRQARDYGISGVPFFVVDGRLGVSGAQPPEVLRALLEQGREASRPNRVASPAGAGAAPGCDGDSCAL